MYEHLISFIKPDHKSSGFQKLVLNKWICRKTCDYFLIDLVH